jgi:hypothetical protein
MDVRMRCAIRAAAFGLSRAIQGNAGSPAFPVRARMARHFQRRKPVKMKEPGNRVFRLRPIFGQDAQ